MLNVWAAATIPGVRGRDDGGMNDGVLGITGESADGGTGLGWMGVVSGGGVNAGRNRGVVGGLGKLNVKTGSNGGGGDGGERGRQGKG